MGHPIGLMGCTSGLVDNRPNVVPGTPEKREYHAFYFKNDAVVGVQGPTISITV
jgi:hypothetical protein